MLVHKISCLVLSLAVLAFIPGMIAASKSRRFSRWYMYGFVLFPVALFHAIILGKPAYFINILSFDKTNPAKGIRKTYRKILSKNNPAKISFSYALSVFVTKLIFGTLLSFAVFAFLRLFVDDSAFLRLICSIFAVVFSLLLSVVELLKLSRFPIFADEITKRTIVVCIHSFLCSFPFFLIKHFILDKSDSGHSDFLIFLCTVASFSLFLYILIRWQRYYYTVFSKFADYCVVSLFSYAIFAALTLIWMSFSDNRNLIFSIAMPAQLFNIDYLSSVEYIKNISFIYSAALAHCIVGLILLYSGLLCRKYKKKEIMSRIEYRAKAFNMTRKRVLRRRIPRMGAGKTTSIYQV